MILLTNLQRDHTPQHSYSSAFVMVLAGPDKSGLTDEECTGCRRWWPPMVLNLCGSMAYPVKCLSDSS